jgi:hypothetical protein
MSLNTLYFPFFAPPNTGGDFVALDHIAALNRLGFDAKAVQPARASGDFGFEVPAVRADQMEIKKGDIVVPGEVHRAAFERLRDVACTKVLHNQNPFNTFVAFDSVHRLNEYPLAHVITPSGFARQKLLDMGVTKSISCVQPHMPSYFAPATKHLQIAYSPRKRPQEASFIIGLFKSRFPQLAHVPWRPLFKMSRIECARIMAQSAIYAGFPLLEGLGLMNLEAMACGCHVVGYRGEGGGEYATTDNGFWIDDGDREAFVTKLKDACELFLAQSPNPFVESGRKTAGRFSVENFERQLRETYLEIMEPNVDSFRLPADPSQKG